MENDFLWWRDGVIYQIYPRSFADSNGDGLGDLPGILSRLDYLVSLGVDAIWLSPIYPSPDNDFGYDVSDHTTIDPRFGTLADFDALLSAAHAKGMHIILDLVLNHTSDQHPWFLASRQSRDDPHHDWYLWRDPLPGGGPPNNWRSTFGGSGWEFDPHLGQYYFHLFAREQPDLNWRHPDVRQAQLDVLHYWLERGVDGFRLDVFNGYFKQADFRDNPPAIGLDPFHWQKHLYDISQPEMHPLLAEMRALLDSYPQSYAVGEAFWLTPEKAASYCGSQSLHAVFNFSYTNTRWSAYRFMAAVRRWEAALGSERWPNYVLGNHDISRLASRYTTDESDARLKVAAAMLLTLRGTPFIYYGEEIGMRDISLRRGQILDPPGKRNWPFDKGRDGCRSPMQWDAGANAGFSSGLPWLPLHPDYPARNVAAQSDDPDSLFNFYRQLIAIRKASPALKHGDFFPLDAGSSLLLAYLRHYGEQTVLVVLNFGRRPHVATFGEELPRDGWEVLLSTHHTAPPDFTYRQIELAPEEVLIMSRTE
jgi:alpha-glucosidase